MDAHDAVFRFGDDPVVGYENVVGSRTTFRFVVDDSDTNPRSQYLGEAQPRDEKKTKTSKPVTRPGSTVAGDEGFVKREEDGVSVSSVSRKEKDGPTKTVRFVRDSVSFKRYLAARLAKPELEIHVAHPNFLAWVDGAVRGSARGSPSPELYGALVAAHKCREVNLYGFQTRAGAADAAERAGEIARESDESDARDDGERVFVALERNLGTASDSGLGAAATPSLDPLEWAVLTRMARSGVLHFAEPCVVECAESAAACDACEADPESSRIARAAIGARARGWERGRGRRRGRLGEEHRRVAGPLDVRRRRHVRALRVRASRARAQRRVRWRLDRLGRLGGVRARRFRETGRRYRSVRDGPVRRRRGGGPVGPPVTSYPYSVKRLMPFNSCSSYYVSRTVRVVCVSRRMRLTSKAFR